MADSSRTTSRTTSSPSPPAGTGQDQASSSGSTAAASSEAATRSRRGTAVTPPATSSLLAAKLKICSAVNRAHTRERAREHSARAAQRREREAAAAAYTTGKPVAVVPGGAGGGGSGGGSGGGPARGRRDSLVRVDSKRGGKKPRERWLLTRKTWRYMADAGRRLIPEGAHNRAEDVPRIEAYFQEVCHREPRFLLWRKSSYPGALGFRGRTSRSRAGGRKKGGSCRDSRDRSGPAAATASADEADEVAAAARGGGTVFLQPVLGQDGSGRFDVQRAKREFLQAGPATTRLGVDPAGPGAPGPWDQGWRDSSASEDSLDPDDKLLLDTLEMYLARDEAAQRGEEPPPAPPPGAVLDEQELLDKLRLRLEVVLGSSDHGGANGTGAAGAWGGAHGTARTTDAAGDRDPAAAHVTRRRPEGVPFNGDHLQKQLLETLRRYYGKSTARQKVISDLLTERKLLERLLFDTRRARGFAYRRGGGSGSGGGGADGSQPYVSSMSRTDPRWRQQAALRGGRDPSASAAGAGGYDYQTAGLSRAASFRRLRGATSPPPLIEVHPEGEAGDDEAGGARAAGSRGAARGPSHVQRGTQTDPLTTAILAAVDEERKRRAQEEADEEDGGGAGAGGGGRPRGGGAGPASNRRRSSVDNDDVSPSVSDTIKRYLRMARKKSMDGDKADRFKRVNYDRNLRNIKAKGEITLPGDDDGLNKGAQTDESWVNAVKELKYEGTGVGSNPDTDELATTSSRLTSSRSSFDTTATGGDELASPSQASPATTSASSTPLQSPKGLFSSGAMQKSKSSSSVVQSLEKIWKTRSKSHSRAAGGGPGLGSGAVPEGGGGPQHTCSWTPQGSCTWSCGGRRVQLPESTPLLQLSEVERQVLQKVALAKLQALNLGVAIRIPSEKVVAEVAAKPKRRAYLLKRKALTTGVVDGGGRKDSDKDSPASGLVFGLPLSQCIEHERGVRVPGNTPLPARGGAGGPGGAAPGRGSVPGAGSGAQRAGLAGLAGLVGRGGASRSSAGAAEDASSGSGSVELRRKSHHGSRASFSSLVEAPRLDDAGSVEDLLGGAMAGSVPGQLNSLSSATSCSATDFLDDEMSELVAEPSRAPWVPHVVTTCLRHLTTNGLHTLGIFRVSSSKKRVRQLREEFDGGQEASLDDDLCPHDVATLLKEYFRDLPDPLLCRDLYQAFVQTQRIRNRRLQAEALQHLVQLLPPAHRDTLHSLLVFLGEVARNAADRRGETGEWLVGNRMDSSNLATLFAPNILHCVPPGTGAAQGDELSAERAEERADTINVVRSMIDNSDFLFQVSAELLDEVYMHMMDSHPQALDQLLRRRAAESGEDVETEVDEHAAHMAERRVWSREEFLHERCATPADEEPVRGSRRSAGGGRRRSRVDSAGDSADSGTGSGSGQGQGVITASLKIPVPGVGGAAFALSVDDADIPFIEDGVQDSGGGRHQVTVGLVRGSLTGSGHGTGAATSQSTSLSQRRRQRSGSGSVGSDSSTAGGAASASQGTRDSAVGSYSSPPRNSSSSPPSWASSPPLSPDPLVRTVNYIPDAAPAPAAQDRRAAYSRTASTSSEHHVQTTTLTPGVVVQRVTFTSIGDGPSAPQDAAMAGGIGGRREREASTSTPKPSAYQRIISSLTGGGGHHATAPSSGSGSELAKSATTSFIGSAANFDDVREFRDCYREEVGGVMRDRIITPSISSIGGAVLRSKTADIERMLRISRTAAGGGGGSVAAPAALPAADDKKKYTKRRYTRHIPEPEVLRSTSATAIGSLLGSHHGGAGTGAPGGHGAAPGRGASSQAASSGAAGPGAAQGVWKRRELIASDPKRREAL
ncbi:Rho GTPase-activating protein 6 [Frankliniella fusca]|uniref:Rho GTPase-activating protein 6 n=1 Tax=Frankliniella fusca TaxID=407009 RepID=A0AAE1HTE3_9NEOP|nr:Rho GTPase-activating protein 6 [Frankliniella fusca]